MMKHTQAEVVPVVTIGDVTIRQLCSVQGRPQVGTPAPETLEVQLWQIVIMTEFGCSTASHHLSGLPRPSMIVARLNTLASPMSPSGPSS